MNLTERIHAGLVQTLETLMNDDAFTKTMSSEIFDSAISNACVALLKDNQPLTPDNVAGYVTRKLHVCILARAEELLGERKFES